MSDKAFVYEAEKGQTIPSIEQHPFGQMMPKLTQQRFDSLCESLSANGLVDPIIQFEGKILEGWHRYIGCCRTGVKPRFAEFDGSRLSALKYVQAKNVERRHLSSSQLAMLAVDFAKQLEDEEKNTEAPKKKRGKAGKKLAAAAEAVGVAPRQAERAKRVVDNADPEVQEAVRQGRVKVADAEAVAKEPKEKQRAAVKSVKGRKAKTLRGAIQKANAQEIPSVDQEPVLDDHQLVLGDMAIRAKADGEAMRKLAKDIIHGSKFLRSLIKDEGRGQHIPAGIDVALARLAVQIRNAAFTAVCPYCLVKELENCETCHGQGWVPGSVAKAVSDNMWNEARRAQRRRAKAEHESAA